jgi:charged multivesicular body protein 6
LQAVIERELHIAKEQLRLKNHHAARLALSKKKYQEQLLDKTGNQLLTIEELTQTIEFALVEQDVMKRLEIGNHVLGQIHKEMDLNTVEKIMDDTADAIAYQNELQNIISQELSPEDEEAIMAQLDEIIEMQQKAEALNTPNEEVFSNKKDTLESFPSVPTHMPEKPKDKQIDDANKGKRKMEPASAS